MPGVVLFSKPKITRGFFRRYQVSAQNILMHLKLSCACSLKPGKRVSVCVCAIQTLSIFLEIMGDLYRHSGLVDEPAIPNGF